MRRGWPAPQRVAACCRERCGGAQLHATRLAGCGDAGLSVGKAIRAAEKDKIPVMCVIGQREADEGAVAVRTYGQGDQGSMRVDDLVARLSAANSSKAAF